MDRYISAIALVLLSLSLSLPVSAVAQPREEVAAFMQARWQAWDDRDADALAAFNAEDAIAVNVTGDQHIGREAIGAWYKQLFQHLFPKDLGPRRCQEATTQMIGDDVAIVTQECTWYDVVSPEMASGRRLPIRHSRATHVLANRGEGWKIVAFRNIPIWNPFAWEGTNR